MVTQASLNAQKPWPHDGSLMGNGQVSGPKRTGGVGVERFTGHNSPPTDWRSPLSAGSDKAHSNYLPPSISKGVSSWSRRRKNRDVADANSLG